MILESIFGMSLVLKVSLQSDVPLKTDAAGWLRLSMPQRQAALLPLVQRATDCIVRHYVGSPRYTNDMRPDQINDLIVDSIAACRRPVRAMIEAHDRLFGTGTGEAFLLGPYLDVLPSAVVTQVKAKAPH